MSPVAIRPATASDLPQILAIYNAVIATSTAIYTTEPSTLPERKAWFEARIAERCPVLVADADGKIDGFASFTGFRGAWPGYRHSVEHSIHVRAERRGQGIGSALRRCFRSPRRWTCT